MECRSSWRRFGDIMVLHKMTTSNSCASLRCWPGGTLMKVCLLVIDQCVLLPMLIPLDLKRAMFVGCELSASFMTYGKWPDIIFEFHGTR